MKAMVLREFHQPFVPAEVPRPSIGAGELLIKVKACGVCYTDVKISSGLTPDIPLPRILGHEVAGEVAGLGEGVKNFHEGDRVSLYFYLNCGKCEYCLQQKENLCVNLRARIGFQWDGGYAEYTKVPATHAFPIPAGISFEEAAILADAVATPLHALRERAQLQAGETLAIIGAGGLGLQAVQIGKLLGARVLSVDLEEKRLALAKSMGAEETFQAGGKELEGAILSYTRGRGVDTVLDLVGKNETMHSSLNILKKGGKLVLVGYSFDQPFSIFPAIIMRGEFKIIGSRACRLRNMEEVIELVAAKKIKPLVTETFPLEQVNEVHSRLKGNEILGRVVLWP
jgi:D-arabinose 1-dehydrogenase-like Zn-dependent alcohol dehydrogenase